MTDHVPAGAAPFRADLAEPSVGLHAWVDESMRLTPHEGTYILAAVVCDPTCTDDTRDQMRALLLRGQSRLHWHDERNDRRSTIAASIASIDMAALVVVGTPVATAKQERARRLCMEVLLPRLGNLGVNLVWLESRTPALNQADSRMVRALRGKQLIPRALRVESARPTEEPMLWIPDALAGAVNAARNDDPRWLNVMRQTVEIIEIGLR
ncbi:MAG: hypothetical protein WCF04_01700 [Candidatus Nanopelagicales bacterium]